VDTTAAAAITAAEVTPGAAIIIDAMGVEARTLDRIAGEFPAADRPAITASLASYAGPEADRVRWDILQLSKGRAADVRRYLEAAKVDYRDVLYWAEYYATDPLLRGRDPKQLVDEVLAKWGKKRTDGS
jgi:hypothetical protein